MYKKNRFPKSISWGIPYSCGCKTKYNKQIYFGDDCLVPGLTKAILEAVSNGEYGSKMQNMLKRHPEGLFDVNLSLYYCDNCQHWDNEERLDFYLPVSGEFPHKNSLTALENNGQYRLLKKYDHNCPKCKEKMREILNSKAVLNALSLECPQCHKLMTFEPEGTITEVRYSDYDIENVYSDYDNVMLAVIRSSFLLENNDWIITHLADDISIYLSKKNQVIRGKSAAIKFLYMQAKKHIKEKTFLNTCSLVILSAETVSMIEEKLETNLSTDKAVLSIAHLPNCENYMVVGHLNKKAQIEYLSYMSEKECSFEVVEENYSDLRRI